MNKYDAKKILNDLPGILKHKEVMEAWVNGAAIQYRSDPDKAWRDVMGNDYDVTLAFLEHYEYRIKPPEPRVFYIATCVKDTGAAFVGDSRVVTKQVYDKFKDGGNEYWSYTRAIEDVE